METYRFLCIPDGKSTMRIVEYPQTVEGGESNTMVDYR